MGIRGENVGTAYVRIIADGSGLDRSIRESFKDSEPSVRQGAKSHGEVYDEEIRKQLRKSFAGNFDQTKGELFEGLNKGLTESIARLELSDRFFNSKEWQKFEDRLSAEGGPAGELFAKRMREKFRDSGNLELIVNDVRNLGPQLRKAQRDILIDMYDEARAIDKTFEAGRKAAAEAALKDRFDMDRDLEAHWRNLADRQAQIDADALQLRLDMDRDLESHWRDLADRQAQIDADAHQVRLDRDRDLEAHWRRLADERVKIDADALKQRLDLDREWELHIADGMRLDRERMDRMNEAYAMNAEFNRRTVAQVKDVTDRYKDLTEQIKRMSAGTEEERHDRDLVIRDLAVLRARMEAYNDSVNHNFRFTSKMRDGLGDAERAMKTMTPRLNKVNAGIDKLSHSVGSAFGADSRNNFIHFIGSMAGGLVQLGKVITLPLGAMSRLARVFKDDGFDAGLKQIWTGIAKLGGVMTGAVAFIGPFVSILSLAAGAVVALASSIGYAAVGAVGALAGAVVPLVGIIGTAILAFKGLDDSQKKALGGITDGFKNWQKIAANAVFDRMSGHIDGLGKALHAFDPIIRRVGTQIGRQFAIIGNSVDKKNGAFAKFIDALETFLPDATKRMGDTFRHTLGGMAGLFRGLIPVTRDFLRWIDELTTKFSKWANSAKGQNAIKNYMEGAKKSAKDVLEFLRSVNDLFGVLLSHGKRAGDSLFTSMTKSIDGWTRALQADNGAKLDAWFKSSEEFAKSLGRVVVGIGKVFDALDSPESRSLAIMAFKALGDAIDVFAAILRPISGLLNGIFGMLGTSAGQVGAAVFAFGKLRGVLDSVGSAARTMAGDMQNAEKRSAALGRAARTAAGVGGILALTAASETSNEKLKVLGETAGGAMLGFSVGGPWGAAVGGAAGLLDSLTKAAHSSWEQFKAGIKMNQDYAGSFDAVTGAITQVTKQRIFSNLQDNEQLTVSRILGIPDRNMVNAAMGDVKAMEGIVRRVKEASKGPNAFFNKESASDFINSLRVMGVELTAAQKKELRMIAATQDLGKKLDGIPKNVRTKVEAIGADPTVAKIEKLKKRYDLTPQQVKTIVSALGIEKAWKDHQKVIDKAKELDRQRPKPKVDADTKAANDKMAAAAAKLRQLNFEVAHPKVDVEWSAADRTLSEIQRRINALYGKTIVVRTQHIDQRLGNHTATGGIFEGARGIGVPRIIGEAGAEAVVPLNRPLSQVDPAVRALSAFAQGKAAPKMASGGVVGGRNIDASGWQIVSNAEDPRAVAAEVVNRLVAVGY